VESETEGPMTKKNNKKKERKKNPPEREGKNGRSV